MTPEQHEQQRLWVAQSLLAEAQRDHNRDTYPRRAPRLIVSADAPSTEESADAQ